MTTNFTLLTVLTDLEDSTRVALHIELHDAGITYDEYGSAIDYFSNLTISSELQYKVIQPCIRARFSQDLASTTGLAAILAAAQSPTISIRDGNGRLVERLITLSEADLQLNSTVTAISAESSKRYRRSVSRGSREAADCDDEVEFDTVVIATPLLANKIDLTWSHACSTGLLMSPFENQSTHVTHFASPVVVSTNLSMLPLDVRITDNVSLTSSIPDESLNVASLQRAGACFRSGCLPGDECDECDDDDKLYRVSSCRYLSDRDIAWLIGREMKVGDELLDYGVRYVQRQHWTQSRPKGGSGPFEYVDKIQIAHRFFYLNGAEGIMSSLEMSCRMAKNVAKQITSRFVI